MMEHPTNGTSSNGEGASVSIAPPPSRPAVVCGPSGVGKGTLIEMLQNRFPAETFGFSVSHTTRKPREGEVDGTHYHFTDVETIRREIDEGKFVEYAEVHGNYYGTSVESVRSVQGSGKICILDIDVQGVRNVKRSDLDPVYVFVAPPSLETLESRLRGRGTETEDAIRRRLGNAAAELEYGLAEGNFDGVFTNDVLEETFEELAGAFRGWYPQLSGDAGERGGAEGDASGSATATAGDDDDDAAEEEEEERADFDVDPLSFPPTNEGLAALLAEVDQECPLEGYASTEMTYAAKGVRIPAGKALDVPLPPVEHDGSKIAWSVTLVDEHQEHLDIEFGLVVLVDHEEVVARPMGRILAPQPQTPTAGGEAEDDEEKDAAEVEPSAKGKFTVTNSAPVTVVIKLDNRYSWFVPKRIDYAFTIVPPVDDNMISRSDRAKSALPMVVAELEAAADSRAKEGSRTETLDRIKSELELKRVEIETSRVQRAAEAEQSTSRADEIDGKARANAREVEETQALVAKEERSLGEVDNAVAALREEMNRLKERSNELEIEKAVREEERSNLVASIVVKMKEKAVLETEASERRAEADAKSKEVEGFIAEGAMIESNLRDLVKERDVTEAEKGRHSERVVFLKGMVDALRMRFIEPPR